MWSPRWSSHSSRASGGAAVSLSFLPCPHLSLPVVPWPVSLSPCHKVSAPRELSIYGPTRGTVGAFLEPVFSQLSTTNRWQGSLKGAPGQHRGKVQNVCEPAACFHQTRQLYAKPEPCCLKDFTASGSWCEIGEPGWGRRVLSALQCKALPPQETGSVPVWGHGTICGFPGTPQENSSEAFIRLRHLKAPCDVMHIKQ